MKEYLKLTINVVYLQEDVLTQSNESQYSQEKDIGWGEIFN